MTERRFETRMMCAGLIQVALRNGKGERRASALLEDISPSGACIQLDFAVPVGSSVAILHAKGELRGEVRYCRYLEIGYYAGLQFEAGRGWRREEFLPESGLDLEP